MHDAQVTLALNIQRLRQDADLSIPDAAARAGVARIDWHRIEGGHEDPDLATMAAMARGLGVPLSALFDRVDE